MSLSQDDRGPPDAYVLSSVPKCSSVGCQRQAASVASKLHLNKSYRPSIARAATLADFTQHASDDSVKEGPVPSAARRRWDAVLQGESDLVQLSEIHPALLSIGVLNGQVCEQATDYFVQSKPPSG